MKKNLPPPVLWIVLAALLLRLGLLLPGWFTGVTRFVRPDTAGYFAIARSLAAGEGYCTAVRPPGYPLLAAFFFRICPDETAAMQALALLGVLAGTLTVWVIYRCGLLYRGERTGLAAALLAALNVTAAANAPLLLTDTVFGLVAALQLLCFLRFRRSKSMRDWLAALALAAFGALIRPIGMLWLLPALVLLGVDFAIPLRRRALLAGTGTLLFLAILTPWMARNAAIGNGFTIDTNTGAMYHQNGAMLLAEVNGSDFESEKAKIRAALAQEFQDHERYPDEASRERYRKRELVKLVLRHPWIFLRQSVCNWRVLLPDAPTFFEDLGVTSAGRGTMGVLAKSGLRAAVDHYFDGKGHLLLAVLPLLLLTCVAYAGCMARLIIDLCRRDYCELLLFAAFAWYYLVLPGAISAPRYQIPALPAVTLLAALALAESAEFLRRKHREKSAPPAENSANA